MNNINIMAVHKSFETYFFEPFAFSYQNVLIKIEMHDKKMILEFRGRKSIKKIMMVFYKVYDLLFLILGAFPKRECVLVNDVELDTSKWVRKYETAQHYIESESRLCEISLKTINESILDKMSDIHSQTLSSVEYIVCEYYSHVVTDHRIELMTHTIDGFLRHTAIYKQLLQQLKKNNPKLSKVNYIECVKRLFICFFSLHRKYNCEIIKCIHIQNKQEFYNIIADTRNDFSHFLESKKYRLIKGSDMVYFIDLIFYAERLFLLIEILGISISNVQAREYMYILQIRYN